MANYFKGAKEFTINGGTFGQDYSRHNTYHGPVHRTNDYSRRTTEYGGYVNHGQHASEGGTINNHGPQTTNNGPIYDYQQYAGSRGGNRRSPQPPSPPEMSVPPSRSGRRYPPQGTDPRYGRDSPRNVNYDNGGDDDDESSDEEEPAAPPPRRRAQQPAASPRRPQAERPVKMDDSLSEELKTLSPETRHYIKTLMKQRNGGGALPPVPPERDLQDRMAGMQLDDDVESSRPPAGRSSPRARPQNPPRKPPARRPPPAHVSDEDSEDDSESDGNSDPYGRTTITSTDSQNVNSTNVVDSHNDNSTKTEISKTYSVR